MSWMSRLSCSPPAQGPPPRRQASPLQHGGSGVPRSGGSGPVPAPLEELPGRPGHAGEMAPGPPEEKKRAWLAAARSSFARSPDQAPDPSAGEGEPQVGLPQNPRGAPEARARCLGHEHRHGAARRRTRPGATPDRADVDPVPETAGVWPPLPRCSLRGGQLGGPPVRARGDDRGPRHGRDRRTDPGRFLRTQEHRCAPTAACIPEDGVPT
jgi:hypothetical protein